MILTAKEAQFWRWLGKRIGRTIETVVFAVLLYLLATGVGMAEIFHLPSPSLLQCIGFALAVRVVS